MPHFENFDQFETASPKSGKKKVIPIAPHSMQAVDYRPIKRDHHESKAQKVEPPFKDVAVEPVSIRQMEKEFKQAARNAPKPPRRKKSGSLWKRLKDFLDSLFGKDKKRDSRARNSGQNRGNRRPRKGNQSRGASGKDGRQAQPRAQGDANQKDGQKPRRRRRRSRNPRQGQDGNSGQKAQRGPSDSQKQPNANSDGSPPKKRARRNRRRRPSGGGQGGQNQNNNNRNPPNKD